MESDTIIGETAEAVLREMEFYKELKRRRMAISICKPKTKLTAQQELAYRRSTCDPVLKHMAKTVLEEIQSERKLRKVGWYFMYGLVFVIFIAVTIVTGFIIYENTEIRPDVDMENIDNKY